jgi:hypothetical protein
MKNEGKGCWEVWHRPSRKTQVLAYHDETTGLKIYTAEYQPNDFEHWVADLEVLSMDFFGKLRAMDAWENKHLISGHDDQVEEDRKKADKREDEGLKYIIKHNRKAFQDLLEYTQSGFHPMTFFTDKKKQ